VHERSLVHECVHEDRMGRTGRTTRSAPRSGGGCVKTRKATDLRQQPVIMLRRAVQATSAHWQDHI
jgi:hypothetical protein